MKFHQLPIGSRFRYQERDYCKTSPLAATDSTGGQRMIPRSAVVAPVDDSSASGGDQATTSSPLRASLQQHHERCRTLVEQACGQLPEIHRLELLKALEDSYRQLVQELDDATG
jgi:hypothetical protein